MKVWVVTAFTAEAYEDYEWVDSVWSTLEKAQAYVASKDGVQEADPKNYDYGYFISEIITEHEVQ